MAVKRYAVNSGALINIPSGAPGSSIQEISGVPLSPMFLKYLSISRNLAGGGTPGANDVDVELWTVNPAVAGNLVDETKKVFDETLLGAENSKAWDRNSAIFAGAVGATPVQTTISWVFNPAAPPLSGESVTVDGMTVTFQAAPPAYADGTYQNPMHVLRTGVLDTDMAALVVVLNRLHSPYVWAYDAASDTLSVTLDAYFDGPSQAQFGASAAWTTVAALTGVISGPTVVTGTGGFATTLWLRLRTTDPGVTSVYAEIGLGEDEADS